MDFGNHWKYQEIFQIAHFGIHFSFRVDRISLRTVEIPPKDHRWYRLRWCHGNKLSTDGSEDLLEGQRRLEIEAEAEVDVEAVEGRPLVLVGRQRRDALVAASEDEVAVAHRRHAVERRVAGLHLWLLHANLITKKRQIKNENQFIFSRYSRKKTSYLLTSWTIFNLLTLKDFL